MYRKSLINHINKQLNNSIDVSILSRLEVVAIGKPKPEGKWFKQGEEIIPSKEFIIENLDDGTSILTITESYPDDTGEIVFEAQNPLGVAVTTTQLLIETAEGKSISKGDSLTVLFFSAANGTLSLLFLNLYDHHASSKHISPYLQKIRINIIIKHILEKLSLTYE